MSGAKSMTQPKKAGKKDKKSRPYKRYPEDLVELAIDMVETNKMSYMEAEESFGVPRQNIRYRLKRRISTLDEEEEILAALDSDEKITRQKNNLDVELKYECAACKTLFQFNSQMKYHIRRHHFNRVGRVPYAESQEVDRVWYEKVLNTDAVVQMKKVSETALIIQQINNLTKLATEIISKDQEEVWDVREIYPISSQKDKIFLECHVCHKNFGRRMLGKHFEKVHAHLLKKKCETCKMKLKRAYNCAIHVCPESIQS